MANNNIRSFYDSEIAMMEHEMIQEQNILEFDPVNLQWYLAGIHDFAEAIIEKIHEREVF